MSILVLFGIIAVFLITAFKPKIGLYLLAASLPVIGRDFYVYNLVVPAADLIALLVLLGFVFNLLFISLFKPKIKIVLSWPLFFPFAIFFLAHLLSIIFSNQVLSSLYYFLRWPLFLYLAYILVPANIIKDTKTLKRAVIIVFLSSLVVLISGYLSLYGQDLSNTFFRLKSLYIFNSYPFGENHNLIAEFLNIGVFFVLIIKEFLKNKRLRRLADVLFVFTALGIILTFSRTGWITLFLQSAVYIYYRLKHNPKEKTAILVVVLLAVAILSPLFWRMSLLQDKNISSTENRLLLTEISLEALQGKPLFGHGSGQFINLVDNNIRFTAKYGPAVDAHGMMQKILAENGLFGLAAWLFLLFYIVKISWQALNKYYPRVKWMLPFSLAVLGGIFFQFFNTSYYKGKVWFPIILFLLALQFTNQRYDKKSKNTTHPAKPY